MKLDTKICKGCDKEFSNSGPNRVSKTRWEYRVFCSAECKKTNVKFNEKVSKRCLTCDKEFFKPDNVRGKNWEDKKYCSSKCANSRPERIQSTKICEGCGKEYHPKGNHSKSKTCSRKCGGIVKSKLLAGEGHHLWAGGRQKTRRGYIMVWIPKDHKYASMTKEKSRVFEHRLVMAEHLGRAILDHETIHHKNGIRDDNRIENLELRTGNHGQGATHHCPTCTCHLHSVQPSEYLAAA